MEYIHRIVDDEIDKRIEAFNAISIVGPKGCGKTRTARERSKTTIEFQDEERRDGYLAVAEAQPSLFLKNPKPILFDEWQDAPKIWGMIRKDCDDHPESVGSYYLTGSTSMNPNTPHTGTGRISELTMFPMTLWETGESNGSVSLYQVLTNPEYDINGQSNEIALPGLFFAACRGGWPRCLALTKKSAQLEVAKDYSRQVYRKDISSIDGVKRNPEWARTLLWSYARNMATTTKKTNIFADVKATHSVSDNTLANYIEALEKLYVIQDIDGCELVWDGERCEPMTEGGIDTYEDHRMALAFAPVSLRMESLCINHPQVVTKSYPYYWNDLRKAQFRVESSE